MSRSILPLAAAVLTLFGAGVAQAQSGANFNAGYGRVAGQENRAAATSTIRDANGNLLIVDGLIQNSPNYSSNSSGVGSNASPMSAQSYSNGVGSGGATGVGVASSVAIGNQLNVITTGNYNTVIVNNNQTNNGQVSAGAIGNGGVNAN